MPRGGIAGALSSESTAGVTDRLCVDQEILGSEMHLGLEFAAVFRQAGQTRPPNEPPRIRNCLRSGRQDFNLLLPRHLNGPQLYQQSSAPTNLYPCQMRHHKGNEYLI